MITTALIANNSVAPGAGIGTAVSATGKGPPGATVPGVVDPGVVAPGIDPGIDPGAAINRLSGPANAPLSPAGAPVNGTAV